MTSRKRKRLRLLDLFCGAGGASVGFHRAGFDVVGVDVKPQKRYPFEFHQADWAEYLGEHWREFDVIAASPPCQLYSIAASLGNGNHPDLVGPVREALQSTGKPYVIENVPGAPLVNPLMLCGTMFPGLRVLRHRLFECWPVIWWPPASCCHWGKRAPVFWGDLVRAGHKGGSQLENFDFITVSGHNFINADASRAMGIDWMTSAELSQAIPPAYTEYVGKQIIAQILTD